MASGDITVTVSEALADVLAERQRQKELAHGGDTEAFDRANSQNDWVAYVATYIGRASSAFRNQREGQDFRANMIKAAATCIAAIEAHDAGHDRNTFQ